MTNVSVSRVTHLQAALNRYLSEDFLGGPRWLKLAWVINAQKGLTAIFVLILIALYNQWANLDAWVYLALHGTYGVLWVIKDVTFPDPGWQKRVTWGGAFMSVVMVLGPYWVSPYLLLSGVLVDRLPASPALIALVIGLHTLGVGLMLGADAQKYFTLRERRGLITDGFFSRVRHPNYLGEMMIYGAYALLVQHWIPWAILAFIWGQLFWTNMRMKEASMARYPEWAAYRARTGMLIPRFWRGR